MSHRLCVAPMMDWTDRHCRYFLRQVSSRAFLYTEMITSGALIHGDVGRHLEFNKEEHPVAAQLGGSEPEDLARCAELVEEYGYDEVNLNCGCPSERVQRGAFGACLMAEPELVADCVEAMEKAVSIPVTVKHRTGIDRIEDYEFMAQFVATVAEAGCTTFIVHARNAVLKGLSPKENREIPPLKYQQVYRLKKDFPQLEIVINGGITSWPQIDAHLANVDGVMLGRSATTTAGSSPMPAGPAPESCKPWRATRPARRACATSPATCWACITATRAPGSGAACCPTRRGFRRMTRACCSKRSRQ